MCFRLYIFDFKKQPTNEQIKQKSKKAKQIKKLKTKKRIYPENRLRKTNLRPLG